MTCFFKGPFAPWKEQFRVAREGIDKYLGPVISLTWVSHAKLLLRITKPFLFFLVDEGL